VNADDASVRFPSRQFPSRQFPSRQFTGGRSLARSSLPAAIFLCFVMGWMAGCAAFQPETPIGFAPYEGHSSFRAVSPDGVMYRVRSEKNEPKADLPFWKEALKKRMLEAGYRFVSEAEVKAGADPGYLLELNAPYGTQDYSYLIALFERNDRLVIVESAGEVVRFKARREAVLAAIQGIRF